jgi:hypothetical protein
MNSYNNIVDPGTGNTFSIFSTQGKTLLKQYVKLLQSGGAGGAGTIVHPIPISDKPANPMLQPNAELLSRQLSLGTIMTEEDERANAALRNARGSDAISYRYEKIPTPRRKTKQVTKRIPVTPECIIIDRELTKAEKDVEKLTAQYNNECASSKQVEKAAGADTFGDLYQTVRR